MEICLWCELKAKPEMFIAETLVFYRAAGYHLSRRWFGLRDEGSFAWGKLNELKSCENLCVHILERINAKEDLSGELPMSSFKDIISSHKTLN
eukprot:s456_g31.t1